MNKEKIIKIIEHYYNCSNFNNSKKGTINDVQNFRAVLEFLGVQK